MEIIYSRTNPPCDYICSSDFSIRDLSIFVDSMETIANYDTEDQLNRKRRRNNKLKAKLVQAEVHPAPSPPPLPKRTIFPQKAIPRPVKSFCKKDTNSSMPSSSDENYFSGGSDSPDGKKMNCRNSTQELDKITNLPADSGTESEVGASELRPRSYAFSTPKVRTTRARIIGVVLKREYANGGIGAGNGHDEDTLEWQKRREKLLEGLLTSKKKKNKWASFYLPSTSSRKLTTKEILVPGKSAKQPSPEMRFLDKALSYLTL